MVSCLEADAVPKTVTSGTVRHSWVAAIPTPPAEEHTSSAAGNEKGNNKVLRAQRGPSLKTHWDGAIKQKIMMY